jgi:glycosyltransferase involved in cell wall biosynthesis
MSDRILLVSPASPFAPQSGAQQRTALLYEALQTLGQVDVMLLEPTAEGSHLAVAKDGVRAHGFWHQYPLGIGKFQPDAALNKALQAAGVDLGEYRLIVSRYLNPLSKLHIPPGVRTLVDLDDWGYHYAPARLSLAAQLKSTFALRLATRQLPRFDAFFFVSARDQAGHPALRSAILPNIPFNPPAQPFPQTDSKTLLFVGSLWYGPNRQGIDRFLQRSWPAIKRVQPQARLLLAGAASPELRRGWETHPDVSAPGFVDDLTAAYRDAAFTIAPIHSGGGTNIKILESLAYGRACVTTPHSADGFKSGLADAGLGIARDDAHFARLCLDWLNDMPGRRNEAEHGHARLEKHYTRALFAERVAQLSSVCLHARSTP